MGNWRFRAGVVACAILVSCSLSSQAFAQAGGSGSTSDTGCDGDKQKAVYVPCAGIEFCTCAEPCTGDSECLSGCCHDGICLPKCVCDGRGYGECKLGEYPSDARESEEGGCAVAGMTSGSAHAGSWFAVGILAGLLACSRRGRARGGQRRARS